MRLKHMSEWVDQWKLPEMFAGAPEMGATDAWHMALTRLEESKLNDIQFCGGVADIAKFFDQIRRKVVSIPLPSTQACLLEYSTRTPPFLRTSSFTIASREA